MSTTRRPQQEGEAPWVVVTGLDGAGKTTLVRRLGVEYCADTFRLPYHDWVKPALRISGHGLPCADVLTDRLLFAADARLTNYLIVEWRRRCAMLVSQRGWMDSYVFGAAQGVEYEETSRLLRPKDLERPSAIIHLIADPAVAYQRICDDPAADKFETLSFMRRQHFETVRFFNAVTAGRVGLHLFQSTPAVIIDTTEKTPDVVFEESRRFLSRSVISAAFASAPPEFPAPCA